MRGLGSLEGASRSVPCLTHIPGARSLRAGRVLIGCSTSVCADAFPFWDWQLFLSELWEPIVPITSFCILLPDSFTRQVLWKLLEAVKFGEVVSYQQLAALAGNPKAARAVGGAMRSNPVSRGGRGDGVGGWAWAPLWGRVI